MRNNFFFGTETSSMSFPPDAPLHTRNHYRHPNNMSNYIIILENVFCVDKPEKRGCAPQ